MILEPHAVPTIIKVDTAFCLKHEPYRYGSTPYGKRVKISKQPRHVILDFKLREFLTVERTGTEIRKVFGPNFMHMLKRIDAITVRKHLGRNPGVYIGREQ